MRGIWRFGGRHCSGVWRGGGIPGRCDRVADCGIFADWNRFCKYIYRIAGRRADFDFSWYVYAGVCGIGMHCDWMDLWERDSLDAADCGASL